MITGKDSLTGTIDCNRGELLPCKMFITLSCHIKMCADRLGFYLQ